MKPFKATFRFYEELNDFLPESKKKKDLLYTFDGKPSIKDAIEAQGVPHPEVDLIIVNGQSVSFDYHLQHNDRVAVYPVFESINISPIVKLRDKPLRKTTFILDVNLGKLAKKMRMLGFDSLYSNDISDSDLVQKGVAEKRIILTRDRFLLRTGIITHAYWVRSDNPERQLKEVLQRFDLEGSIKPFKRCLECNQPLEPVTKEEIMARLEPKTKRYFDTFHICRHCDKIYWKGSHWENMVKNYLPDK
jgi:uncharacterized protein with PIN domain